MEESRGWESSGGSGIHDWFEYTSFASENRCIWNAVPTMRLKAG